MKKKQATRIKNAKKFEALLRNNPQGMTKRSIMAHFGWGEAQTKNALARSRQVSQFGKRYVICLGATYVFTGDSDLKSLYFRRQVRQQFAPKLSNLHNCAGQIAVDKKASKKDKKILQAVEDAIDALTI